MFFLGPLRRLGKALAQTTQVGNGHATVMADHLPLVLDQKKSPTATLPVHRGKGQPDNACCTNHRSGRFVLRRL